MLEPLVTFGHRYWLRSDEADRPLQAVPPALHIAPGLFRRPELHPLAPTARLVGGVPPNGNFANAKQVITRFQELINPPPIDVFGMKQATARQAYLTLGNLGAGDLLEMTERTDANHLSRLDEGALHLDRQNRDAVAKMIDEVRRARNTPINPPDFDTFVAEARHTLGGTWEGSFVTAAQARHVMDQLRRFDSKTIDRALDRLGPFKTHWMLSKLSREDKETYAPTIEQCELAHFGAVARSDALRGLTPKDVTDRLKDILELVERKDPDMRLTREKHGDVKYVFIPGLVTEHQPGYFQANMDRLKERGLDVFMPTKKEFDTDADMDKNSEDLRNYLEKICPHDPNDPSKDLKKLFLISHSKGGPDTRLALRDKSIERKVFFWNSMQAACGTPIASELTDAFGPAIEGLLKNIWHAPNGNAIKDLDYARQKELWVDGPPLECPILSLATSAGTHTSGLRLAYNHFQKLYDLETDGLVPTIDQIIGGLNAYVAMINDVDHAAPAAKPAPGMRPKHDPADLQEAQILLAYEIREKMMAMIS